MPKNKIAKYNSNTNDRKVSKQVIYDTDHSAKLQLHKEELDISKKWIKTGEVSIHKEVFTEEKTITIPVTHEELIIEKKVLATENPDQTGEHTEIIRIPISEERIEVIKHPTVLEDVAIYKRQFQETKSVTETLKKEKVHIETTGNPEVVDENTEK
ncbi:YsnF/AvaK domain-containing protein [Priestia megaterium]|uniref:YsnF/AvaK domain-containing protein n=1 Tax=Priestia megaterium TaxID=1404 RepID=UPI002A6AE583|nr:YsnF/AvaK domain-containing protein [Priestia megaterium]MDY0944017.1 YsnF/AvaK domain-containing protein [Priestia megaterium]MED4287252.1 YsnF/AvaK domain-containing protein [Priestia megaterium]MED4298544.1 YsnF/AvaK domain-containing protein [Priestia megaterium]